MRGQEFSITRHLLFQKKQDLPPRKNRGLRLPCYRFYDCAIESDNGAWHMGYDKPTSKDNGQNDTNFARYCRDLSRVKILNAADERVLLLKYHETGCPQARDQLARSGLRFVVRVAKQYTSSTEQLKDLVSAGNQGLLNAIDHFDPCAHKTRLLSYAEHWIRLRIREALNSRDIVRMPVWRRKSVQTIRHIRARVRAQTGEEPSAEYIATQTDLTPEQVQRLSVSVFNYIEMEENDLPPLADPNIKTSNNGTQRAAIQQELQELSELLLSKLSVREQFILRSYYGFIADGLPLESVANVLSLSPERVRQIKEQALGKLRKYSSGLGVRSSDDVCP